MLEAADGDAGPYPSAMKRLLKRTTLIAATLLSALALGAPTTPLTRADEELPAYDAAHPETPWPTSSAPSSRALASDPAVRSEQLEIAAAVMRHLVAHNESGAQPGTKKVCVQLFGKDPPAALLRQLAALGAQPASGCHRGDVVLDVSGVKPLDGQHAEAHGGYYEGPLSAASHEYWLRRVDGRWQVVGDVLGVIS